MQRCILPFTFYTVQTIYTTLQYYSLEAICCKISYHRIKNEATV